MYFVLNALQAVFLALWSAFWISLAGLVSFFNGELPLVMARRCWAPGLIWASLARVRVVASAKLDSSQSYVFVMNHQSMFDIAVAFGFIPKNIRFVGKSELKKVPFIGFFMARTGMVFVDRTNPGQAYQNLEAGARKLKGGASIIAYPEGTRSTDGTIKPFKRGPFITAVKAGVPIVPVVIEGSGSVLPRGGFHLRPGEVRLAIGAPIPTRGRSPDDVAEIMRETRQRMIDLHRSIGGAGAGADAKAAPNPDLHPVSQVVAGR